MSDVDVFLDSYPDNVSGIASAVRKLIVTTLPGADETLDAKAKVVGYSVGPGYAGMVCTIILSKTGVKLGIVRGASMADPNGLLEGDGKKHRYVAFKTAGDVKRDGIVDLLKTAQAAATR